jgi:hypothetical protein
VVLLLSKKSCDGGVSTPLPPTQHKDSRLRQVYLIATRISGLPVAKLFCFNVGAIRPSLAHYGSFVQ